jgi:2-polyprenyl-3-methyl-5-hydroxy-6-metoxy-1,4-benzoquinol methylase
MASATAVEVACPLCGSTSSGVRFPAGVAQVHQIVQCRDCQMMYANPRVGVDEHVDIATYDPDYVLTHSDRRLEKEALQVRDTRNTRKILAERYPKRGKLLEVGAGFGFLLQAFKEDGWSVLGVEPNRAGAVYAKEKFDIEILPAILEESGLPAETFDVVLMLHVIEHVPSPLDTLRTIHNVLKPGGMLVMETPRYDTLTFKLLGKRERSVSCDGHIHFFTSTTLRAMAERAGFAVARNDYVGRSLSLDRLAWNLGVMLKSRGVANVLGKASSTLHLNKGWVHLNARDMQRMYLVRT